MEQNAITADEWARVEAAEGPAALASVRAEPILAYGATLLAALATVRGILLTQLGDGDILVVGWNDEVSRPLPRDQRLTGNRTTSLCLADAERDFRAVYIDDRHERVQLVVLTTDGYANSFRSDSDFLQIGIDFAAMVRARGAQTVAGELEPILREASEQGSGDDITLALISSLPHSPSTIRPGSDAAPPRRDARGLRRRLVLAAIATAIAAGVWVERERRGQVSGHGSSPP